MEEANLDFLKKLTTKQTTSTHNNHVNRSYLGVKTGSKSSSSYMKTVLQQNERMKNEQVLQNTHQSYLNYTQQMQATYISKTISKPPEPVEPSISYSKPNEDQSQQNPSKVSYS